MSIKNLHDTDLTTSAINLPKNLTEIDYSLTIEIIVTERSGHIGISNAPVTSPVSSWNVHLHHPDITADSLIFLCINGNGSSYADSFIIQAQSQTTGQVVILFHWADVAPSSTGYMRFAYAIF